MSQLRLLIANSSPEFCRTLTELTQPLAHAECCRTGTQALRQLRNNRYDLLLLDLELPELDGLTILNTLHEENIHPATLVTMTCNSPYVSKALARLPFCYAMVKPCLPAALLANLEGMAAVLTPEVEAEPVTARPDPAAQWLQKFHLIPKHDGYHYFLAAIPQFSANPGQFITKELYNSVGKAFGKTSNQVERSMRTALEFAWNADDDGIWQTYFPGLCTRPSNKSFLTVLSQLLSPASHRNAG